MKRQYRISVLGKVQGVFYRKFVQEKAQSLNLTGQVKNESDGSVSIVALGEESGLNSFLELISEGPEQAKVKSLQIEEEETKQFGSFDIVD